MASIRASRSYRCIREEGPSSLVCGVGPNVFQSAPDELEESMLTALVSMVSAKVKTLPTGSKIKCKGMTVGRYKCHGKQVREGINTTQ